MDLKLKMKSLIFLTLAALRFGLSDCESCKTIFNTDGVCKLDRDCPVLINKAIKNRTISQMMSENRCGFSGTSLIVCCPIESDAPISFARIEEKTESSLVGEDCLISANVKGICSLAVDCPLIRAGRSNLNSVLVKKRCGFQGGSLVVCCPARIDPTENIFEVVTRKSEQACKSFGPRLLPFSPRIIGGSPANVNELPQFAMLGYQNILTEQIIFNCGGVLISRNFILTAAHCVVNSRIAKLYVIRLGKNSIDDEEDPTSDYHIKNVITHPQYKINGSKYNDIALIELSRPVEFDSSIWPACLSQEENVHESPLIIAGYGRTSIIDASLKSEKLLKATVYEVPLDECKENYKTVLGGNLSSRFKLPSGILDTLLCSKSRKNHADTCQGDSGSGIFKLINQTYHVAGITSFGLSCNSSLPAFYTRVSKYLTWIEDIVWPN